MRFRTLIPTSATAVAGLSLLAAGCGGGGSPVVASLGSSTTAATTTAQSGLVAYSGCMRSHEVPEFPDPDSSGEIPKEAVIPLANSPQFRAAATACEHLLPNGSLGPQETAQQQRTQVAGELSFAGCMRSHGVTSFPDPTAQGLSIGMIQAQGIDLHSPAVLRVVDACLPASHGALTPAKVREALSDAGG
jgi:hypothetical protein